MLYRDQISPVAEIAICCDVESLSAGLFKSLTFAREINCAKGVMAQVAATELCKRTHLKAGAWKWTASIAEVCV